MFPSPTGVNYYESIKKSPKESFKSFRPQQGLIIMNLHIWRYVVDAMKCFRPQQGLIIMNGMDFSKQSHEFKLFPSPTGVNYYE